MRQTLPNAPEQRGPGLIGLAPLDLTASGWVPGLGLIGLGLGREEAGDIGQGGQCLSEQQKLRGGQIFQINKSPFYIHDMMQNIRQKN